MLKWRPISRFSFLILLSLFFVQPAAAHSAQSGDLAIGHIWGAPPTQNTIDVYGPFLNKGRNPDALVDVTSPHAKYAKLIRWIRGTEMVLSPYLDLPPGNPQSFNPQGPYLRLYGIDKNYAVGDKFPVTFRFRHAPPVTIDVIVQAKNTG